jgi:hypothetical protein
VLTYFSGFWLKLEILDKAGIRELKHLSGTNASAYVASLSRKLLRQEPEFCHGV